MSTAPTWIRRAAVALAITSVLGCGPSASPSPPAVASPSPSAVASPGASTDAAAIYAAIATQVEQIRGLQPKTDVAPVLIDADQLRANFTADFDHDNPPAVVQASQDLFVELGLLAPGASLRSAYLDLQSGQVAGYYSPDHKQLFVVSRSGGVGPTQRVTYAHEFTHQLQDQNFDLSRLDLGATDQGDRSLGRLALVEGDAVSTQTTWMTSNLTAADLSQLLADASDPAALAALQHAPAILRATSLFPYIDGPAFVSALQASGGEAAVNAAFADAPDSTAQVIHPDLYLRRVAPVVVKLPATLATSLGSGWSLLGEDTLGELMIRGWLNGDGIDASTAATAASGWAGDRIAILAGPSGQLALAMVIRWTSAAELKEFSDAFEGIGPRLGGDPTYNGTLGANTVSIVIAPNPRLGRILSDALHS